MTIGMTERREKAGELAVRRDCLTGLPGEAEFLRVAAETQAIMGRDGSETTLVLLAVESSRGALETLPTALREAVPRLVATCLSMTFRSTDTVAHTGGGLFGMLLPETALEGAQQAVSRAADAVAALRLPGSPDIVLKAEAGYAVLPVEGALQDVCDAAVADLAARAAEIAAEPVILQEVPVALPEDEIAPSVAAPTGTAVSILIADHNVGRQIVAGSVLHRHGYYDPLLATSRNATRQRLLAEKPDFLLVALEYDGFGHGLLKEMGFSVGSGKRIIIAAHAQSRPFADRMVTEGKALGVIDLPYDALTMGRTVSRLTSLPEEPGEARDKRRLDIEIRALTSTT